VAKPGTTKWFSQLQERRVARRRGGRVSPSSGGHITDQGDVRVTRYPHADLPASEDKGDLIECKHTGTFKKPARSISVKLDDLEKIADEAWSENRRWLLELSIYAPGSVLADQDGFVDLTVRSSWDDVAHGS